MLYKRKLANVLLDLCNDMIIKLGQIMKKIGIIFFDLLNFV